MNDLEETGVEAAVEQPDVPAEELKEEDPPCLNSTVAVKLGDLEFMEYERNIARAREAQLTVQMYERELTRAKEALAKVGHAHTQHVILMAAKHKVDLSAMMVSDDGFFMPTPPQALRR
jgi:hypothetical protein